ncbi:heterokaryon incompatibility protein-domain-containing protein [Paraphoma chrysanthemicola]|uniref:Heterokaryon incompatibility protein-domain-containing protein n=1 Tax=Paraphoma chrysanthemicola TaxID=798071 RepID=A0A8K0W2S7_9PLEO|nr:heterokaryon incompatibility protein-domain-containing protein [Paraphoma chrysanthemicola]
MRLLDATTLLVHEFFNEAEIPPYAILSHTWEEEECTLQQTQSLGQFELSKRKGYKKIQLCCEQALRDGLNWAWVDTCCIDKTSTAELSEAINSMFRWYRNAVVCYAYLTDVEIVDQFGSSRWFTRGWTLQELVAPYALNFYNKHWKNLGSKLELHQLLQQTTGIDTQVLTTGELDQVCVAQKMSWAATRQTTRTEDLAYSLLGIFSVNMPLLYGEGSKAFLRLQEEIMKTSEDQSLFAWGLPKEVRTISGHSSLEGHMASTTVSTGIFAESPSQFTSTERIHVLEDVKSTIPPLAFNNGVRIELQSVTFGVDTYAIIYCTLKDRDKHFLAFRVLNWGERWVARLGDLVTIAVSDLVNASSDKPYADPEIFFIKQPDAIIKRQRRTRNFDLVRLAGDYERLYQMTQTSSSPNTPISQESGKLSIPADEDRLHAVFYFEPDILDPMTLTQELGNERGAHQRIMDSSVVRNQRLIKTKDDGTMVVENYHVAYPPFALLIGGKWPDLWVDCAIILVYSDTPDNKESDLYFHDLQSADPELVRCCTTMTHLLSLLRQQSPLEPLTGQRSQRCERPIMHWQTVKRYTEAHMLRRKKKSLVVDAQIKMVSRSLLERSLVLFVQLRNPDDVDQEPPKEPNWWEQDV